MCMARVNVYLPDDLADRARLAGLNVSGLTQAAIREALAARAVDGWLDAVAARAGARIPGAVVREALDAARAEMEDRG